MQLQGFYLPLRFCAMLYGWAVRQRQRAYACRWLNRSGVAVPVVSIGGLEVGGSGKTPVAMMVLKQLQELGYKPGLASRGYRRQRRGLFVRRLGEPARWQDVGDEPAMMVEQGLDVPLAICRRRLLAAQALQQLGCDVVVLDDGFTHHALHRDLDVVVLRREAPFANGQLLPAGRLREMPHALARAHVLWLHQKTADDSDHSAELEPFNNHACVVQTKMGPAATYDLNGRAVCLQDQRVVVAAAIADPHQFAAHVQRCGGVVLQCWAFADHLRYQRRHVVQLQRCLRHQRAQALVVTAKDAVKLRAWWPQPTTLWIHCPTMQWLTGRAVFVAMLQHVVENFHEPKKTQPRAGMGRY